MPLRSNAHEKPDDDEPRGPIGRRLVTTHCETMEFSEKFNLKPKAEDTMDNIPSVDILSKKG